jgi:hypothetical protein
MTTIITNSRKYTLLFDHRILAFKDLARARPLAVYKFYNKSRSGYSMLQHVVICALISHPTNRCTYDLQPVYQERK